MLETKNSQKRVCARSPAEAIRAGARSVKATIWFMPITSSGWRGSDGVAAVHLLAEIVSLIAEIARQLKVISTFVEERLPANGELIPHGLNWLRRVQPTQGQTRFVGRIV